VPFLFLSPYISSFVFDYFLSVLSLFFFLVACIEHFLLLILAPPKERKKIVVLSMELHFTLLSYAYHTG
jgi:hypothetical protein